MTTKLHVAVDSLGNPVRVILTAGQISDIGQAGALIKDQPAEFIVADKGYDSDAFIETITAQGCQAVIPPRSNRLTPRTFDRHIYKDRNLIERFFCRIKQFRRIAVSGNSPAFLPTPKPQRDQIARDCPRSAASTASV